MAKHVVKIHTSLCVGCGLCARTCAAHNIVLKNKKAETILDDCILCGQCSAVCPKEAVAISGYDTKPITQNGTVRLNPHEVLDVIRFRRTIRQFQKKEIPHAVLEQILEQAASHIQPKICRMSPLWSLRKKKTLWNRWLSASLKSLSPLRICSVLWPGSIKYTLIFSSSGHLLSLSSWQKTKPTAYSQHKIWSLWQRPTGWVCCSADFSHLPPTYHRRSKRH